MELQKALCGMKKCQPPALMDYSVLQMVTQEDFYYPSPVSLVSKSENSKFVLFSAPGAVGKTALAKYIAQTYNGFYWNVAAKPVGGTSFAGEIAHAVGLRNGALQDKIYSDLNTGDILFVLDSFDEAALISRREGVKDFLIEIGNILENPQSPTIIITARTEMAQFIVNICNEFDFGITQYCIDYFEEVTAPIFIEKYFEYQNQRLSYEQRTEIQEYIDKIKRHIGDSNEVQSFIGYAQVLRILCRQIENAFFVEKSKKLPGLAGSSQNSKLIYDIIQELIIREQDKLTEFKNSIRNKYSASGKERIVDSLYCKQEQLIRLHFYTFADQAISIDDYGSCSELLPEDANVYLDLLRDWLPQHVFLQNGSIMPIFSDYLLAESLLNPDLEMFAEEYREGTASFLKLPTRVFMDCYLSLSQGNVRSDHICLLDLAYSSQTTIGSSTFCDIGYEESENGDEDEDLFLSFSDSNVPNAPKITMKIIRDVDEPIRLNRAENMNISVDGTIILSPEFIKDVSISQAFIECDRLEFAAPDILLETYGNEENCIIAHETATKVPGCKLNIVGTKNLKIDFPFEQDNTLKRIFYELYPFQYSFDNTSETEDTKEQFTYGLKKVLEQFKADKYEGDPAKFKEKIDNRCHIGIKAKVLSFLKSTGLIYEDGIMYKCSLQVMDNLRISRVAYTQFKFDQLEHAYSLYLQWCKND